MMSLRYRFVDKSPPFVDNFRCTTRANAQRPPSHLPVLPLPNAETTPDARVAAEVVFSIQYAPDPLLTCAGGCGHGVVGVVCTGHASRFIPAPRGANEKRIDNNVSIASKCTWNGRVCQLAGPLLLALAALPFRRGLCYITGW
ncbi:MAG TPA: hypothetical protein VF099_06145 [Ktedonobacterales bacterium]